MVNSTTEIFALIIAAFGVTTLTWRKIIKPFVSFVRAFKAWMQRVDEGLSLVEEQMRPNSGKTLMDRTTANSERLERIERQVSTLLAHDRERDQPGLRYGPEDDPDKEI